MPDKHRGRSLREALGRPKKQGSDFRDVCLPGHAPSCNGVLEAHIRYNYETQLYQCTVACSCAAATKPMGAPFLRYDDAHKFSVHIHLDQPKRGELL